MNKICIAFDRKLDDTTYVLWLMKLGAFFTQKPLKNRTKRLFKDLTGKCNSEKWTSAIEKTTESIYMMSEEASYEIQTSENGVVVCPSICHDKWFHIQYGWRKMKMTENKCYRNLPQREDF